MPQRRIDLTAVKSQYGTLSEFNQVRWLALIMVRCIKEDISDLRSANEDGDLRCDAFITASGIDAGLSSGYTWRGSPNYDVIATTSIGYVVSTGYDLSEEPTHVMIYANVTLSTGSINFYASRMTSPGSDLTDTAKWKPVSLNTITDISSLGSGTKGRWAVKITSPAELDDITVVFGRRRM